MGQVVNMRELKDGTGRCCVHWLRPNPDGKIVPLQQKDFRLASIVQVTKLDGRASIACRPEQNCVLPQQGRGETLVCLRSPSPGSVTCLDCMETVEFGQAAAMIEQVRNKNK